jgi:DNA-binding NtrC family response regulator
MEGLAFLDDSIQLIISDLRLGNDSGLNLLEEIRSRYSDLPFIVVTAFGDIATAVHAIKLGALDFLTKPVEPKKLLELIREKFPQVAASCPDRDFSRFGGMIGASESMQQVFQRIQRAAEVDCNVLITGETGTGKELVAAALHQYGKRSGRPFIATNISAVPLNLVESELFGVTKGAFTDAVRDREGVLSSADGGTLFIDEVGELPLGIQPKLLRVLEGAPISSLGSREQRKIDVRFVFATHRDLRNMVSREEFRSDLWHRISVLTIDLPPLRERREDIPILFETFLSEFCTRHQMRLPGVAPELRRFIESYSWPGNIRQLRNAIESMVVMHAGDQLSTDDLSHFLREEAVLSNPTANAFPLRDYERAAILKTLKKHSGNRTAAADELGISVRTLQRKLKRWGLEDNTPQ